MLLIRYSYEKCIVLSMLVKTKHCERNTYQSQNITMTMIFQMVHARSISFDPCLAPPIKRMLITKVVTEITNAGPEIEICI